MGKIYKNGILFAGSTENARSVAFDNADTGLESTNVQEAIEEIKSDVTEINGNLSNMLLKESINVPFSIEANTNKWIDKYDIQKNGYVAIGIVGYYLKNANLNMLAMYISANGTAISSNIKNDSNNSVSTTIRFEILYLRH